MYTAIKNFVNLCLSLNKNTAVLSCDMSIYLIAKKIQQSTEEFQELILRIGTFHLQKNFLRCLGQYIEGSGLDSILIEANVYGSNTLAAILKGTQYNRGIRAHKLMYEALRSIQFSLFIDYIHSSEDDTSNNPIQELVISLQEIREMTVDHDHSGLSEKYSQHKAVIEEFLSNFLKFVTDMSSENELFKYLNNYCEMVEILLNSILADRCNDFELHLLTTRQMLPYFFTMNHTNYI